MISCIGRLSTPFFTQANAVEKIDDPTGLAYKPPAVSPNSTSDMKQSPFVRIPVIRSILAMNPNTSSFHATLLLAIAMALLSPVQSQEHPTGLFFGSVDVQVVNIDVHVSKKDGTPITDLTLEDFELLEDGRPVTISDFFSVKGGRLDPRSSESDLENGAEPSLAELPPGEISDQVPENQRLHLVLYVDNFNLHPLSRRWVIDGVNQFLLNYVNPEDRVLVVSYDRDLKIRTRGFVNDRQEISEALEAAALVTAHAVNRDGERQRVLQDIDRADDPLFALSEARAHADFVRNELGFGIDAVRDVVTKIAGIDGRKAMLYISDGVPRIPGEDLFLAATERFQQGPSPDVFRYDMSRRYRELTAQANAAGVTLYTLDARGLHSGQSTSAEINYTNLLNVKTLIDNTHDLNLQAPLIELADDTGGQAILNTNALGPAFRALNQDLRTYYSLGYQPLSTDGRYHRLEVKVNRPGIKIRHRSGYRAKARDQRIQESSSAALDFGLEKNPLEAEILFGQTASTDGDLLSLPVEVHVPIGSLTLVPSEGKHHGRLRILVGIRDQRGNTSGVFTQQPADIVIPDSDLETARTQRFVYQFTLGVEAKPQQVLVTIIDDYGTAVSHLLEAISPRPS